MMRNFLMAGIGGMIGSMLRYGAYVCIKQSSFPWATLAVNIIGSFVIGAVAGYALKDSAFDADWRLFLATGVCGGFTTFSAFSYECMQMFQQQRYTTATMYIAVSIVAGIAFAFGGWALATRQ